MYTRQQKIAALKRELTFRRRVYPRQIHRGQMSQDEADHEIAILQAIIADYDEQDNQTVLEFHQGGTQ